MDSPAALAADQQGALWVVDTGNHRVLRMDNAAAKPIGGAADGVLGQPDFSQNNPSISADGLTWPSAIAVESVLASGIWTPSRLWVGDGVRNRVLLFTNPTSKPDGGAADLVLGQPTFTDSAFATTRNGMNGVSGLAVAGGTLWVDVDSRSATQLKILADVTYPATCMASICALASAPEPRSATVVGPGRASSRVATALVAPVRSVVRNWASMIASSAPVAIE